MRLTAYRRSEHPLAAKFYAALRMGEVRIVSREYGPYVTWEELKVAVGSMAVAETLKPGFFRLVIRWDGMLWIHDAGLPDMGQRDDAWPFGDL